MSETFALFLLREHRSTCFLHKDSQAIERLDVNLILIGRRIFSAHACAKGIMFKNNILILGIASLIALLASATRQQVDPNSTLMAAVVIVALLLTWRRMDQRADAPPLAPPVDRPYSDPSGPVPLLTRAAVGHGQRLPFESR